MADLQSEQLDVNTSLIEAADGSISNSLIATSYLEDYLFKIRADLVMLCESADDLQAQIDTLEAVLFGSDPYTIGDVTEDRVYNADATTIDELADVLGTLIADLQSKGILS